MFDPIKGPPNEYLPPATGHGTEFGDSWHTAVAKINDGFKRVIEAMDTEMTELKAKLESVMNRSPTPPRNPVGDPEPVDPATPAEADGFKAPGADS
jgi:hypothetical protein